jgi:hypothetical protein
MKIADFRETKFHWLMQLNTGDPRLGQSNRVVKRRILGYGPVIMKRATLQLTVNSICCSKVKGVDEDAAGTVAELRAGSDQGDLPGDAEGDAISRSSG